MNTQAPFKVQRNRHIFLFLVLSMFAVGTLFFAAGTAAQSRNVNVAVGNFAVVNAMPPPPKTTVRGRIIYEDTGRAVRRASFSFVQFKSGAPKSGLTDDNGEFVLKDVSGGKYHALINAPGVLNMLSYLDFSADSPEEALSESGEDIAKNFEEIVVPSGGEIQVLIRAKRGGAIGGRIFYADGAPAISVRVEVMRKTASKFVGVIPSFGDLSPYSRGELSAGRTDDRGVYRISGLPPGEYIVKVTEPASHNGKADSSSQDYGTRMMSSLISVYHPDVSSVDQAQSVSLEMSQEVEGVNVTVPERQLFTVNGKVVGKGAQQPLNGTRISLKAKSSAVSANERMLGEAAGFYTDEKGTFEFRDIPAGTYTIKVTPPETRDVDYDDEGNPKPIQNPKPKFANLEKEIVVSDKNLSDLIIELPFGGGLYGTVSTDAPNQELPSFIKLNALNEKGETVGTTSVYTSNYEKKTPQNKSEFKMDNLLSGKLTLRVEPNQYRDQNDTSKAKVFYTKSIKIGTKDYSTAAFEIAEGQSVSKIEVVVGTDGGRLKGMVKAKNNEPYAAKKLLLVPTEQSQWTRTNARLFVFTNGKGEFEIEGAPLEYFVFFLVAADKLSEINENWIRERSGSAEKVRIKANDETAAALTAP